MERVFWVGTSCVIQQLLDSLCKSIRKKEYRGMRGKGNFSMEMMIEVGVVLCASPDSFANSRASKTGGG